MSTMKSIHHSHVLWSRNQPDKFVAISTDVKLFEFTNQQHHQTLGAQHGSSGIDGNKSNHPKDYASLGGLNQSTKQQPDYFINSRLIATGPEISLFKAAACYPGSISDDHTLVAISCGGVQNTGKIVLVRLSQAGMYSIDNYVHVDLVAKRAICNDVDWSHATNSLLATGWDRHKVDNSLQIFDISRITDAGKYSFNFSITPNSRPVFDGCPGDSINSLRWFRKEQSVVCGMNNKQVRIYDTRDLTKPKLTASTRAVHGVTVDPFTDKRFASFVDNTINIWDIRFFDKPLVTINESKHINQISWCTTRNHTFSALMADDDFVKIYDIQQASLSEDFDAKIVERLIHPFAQSSSTPSLSSSPTSTTITASAKNAAYDPASIMTGSFMSLQNSSIPKKITSFDWHPTSEFRMIAISNTRDVIALNICDRITLNWSPICEIVWTKGKKFLQCLDARDEKYKSLDDISVNMRHRAITNYGMIVEDGPHHQRGDDSDLIGLLRWVKLAKALDITSKRSKQQKSMAQQQPSSDSNGGGGGGINDLNKLSLYSSSGTEILGVGSLLRNSAKQTPSQAEMKPINWKGGSVTACVVAPIKFQVYNSELRSRALLLCDWIPDIDNISQTIPIIDYLEKEGNYMRAAAIAVFNMRLQRAIDSLTIGATKSDPNLSSVAMALSGYTGERTSMWREMCQTLKGQLTNPYMKAMFAFLTSESDPNFHEIIYDKELILADRVAFSLLYLPDDKLNVYLTETMSTLVDNGDLNGILLTGITNDGLSLLQRYIEISSDIQSVSLIVLHSLPSAICSDPRAQLWVECYRGMLDCWRLWHQRAQFDNLWYSNSLSSAKPPTHILISCNYCGNTINKSQQHQQQNQQQQQHQHQPSNQNLSLGNLPAANFNYASSTSSNSQHSHTGGSSTQPQGTPAVTTTDYYQSQQVASSVPVTISGMSASSIASNSSSNTLSSAATAISAGTTLGASTAAPGTSSNTQQLTIPSSPSLSTTGEMPSPTMSSSKSHPAASGNNNNSARLTTSTVVVPQAPTGRSKSCANCKKCSFAKCCLCLTQLGSNQLLFDHKSLPQPKNRSSRGGKRQQQKQQTPNAQQANKTNPFSNWFSWCQTCRHGAHSAHLLSWFSENTECPVSGCDCKCMNLDSRTKMDMIQKA